jgi:hypothetical protein
MLAEATFQAINSPVAAGRQRTSGLRFADPHVHQLLHALILFRHGAVRGAVAEDGGGPADLAIDCLGGRHRPGVPAFVAMSFRRRAISPASRDEGFATPSLRIARNISSWNQRRRKRRSHDIGLCHRLLNAHDTAACEPADNPLRGNRPLIAAEFAICPDSGGAMRRIATVASSNAAFPVTS